MMVKSDKIIVIGASHGGFTTLKTVLQGLPRDFPAPVLVAMHIGALASQLPELLGASCELAVRQATEGDVLEAGTVLLAPPDRHMLVEGNHVRLMLGAKENYSRPAIDPLFRSAAMSYRERVIGLVLTGDLDDGTVGLQAIKACGGVALVQDPTEAIAPSMPSSVLRYVDVDACLSTEQIAQHLVKLVPIQRPHAGHPSPIMTLENDANFAAGSVSIESLDHVAARSAMTCPECHGVLWELDTAPLRYRCHTGHCYGELSIRVAQDTAIEDLLWAAVRAFHEKEHLMLRQIESASLAGRHTQADEYKLIAEQARGNSHSLRQLLTEMNTESVPRKDKA